MKKILFVFLTGLTIVLFMSSSIWEGSASVSYDKDLPESGFYAATSSFPVNTVINITNLENGSTIRATVYKNLDTPGLLVLLSKDAAESIGLGSRSIGRVRMDQLPADLSAAGIPAGIFSAGDPDHDPAAYVSTNGLNPALYEVAGDSDLFIPDEITIARDPEPADTIDPSYPTDTTIAADTTVAADITDAAFPTDTTIAADTTVAADTTDAAFPTDTADTSDALAAYAEEETPFPNNPYVSDQTPPTYITNYYEYNYYLEPTGPRIPSYSEPQINPEDVVPFSYPLDQYPSEFYPSDNTREPAPAYQYQPPPAPQAQLPVRDYSIDPADVIPPISSAPPAVPAYTTIPQDEIIPPVSEAPVPAPTATPAALPVPAPTLPAIDSFSVPVIFSLEKGKYYIQVIAGPQTDGIESEIRKIGRSVPMAVQPAGTSEKPTYRLLIGPVNLGESGALLERYKAAYKDAFVRVGS